MDLRKKGNIKLNCLKPKKMPLLIDVSIYKQIFAHLTFGTIWAVAFVLLGIPLYHLPWLTVLSVIIWYLSSINKVSTSAACGPTW